MSTPDAAHQTQSAEQQAEQQDYYERKRAAAQGEVAYDTVRDQRDRLYEGRVVTVRALCILAWLGVITWCVIGWMLWPLLIGVVIHLLGAIYVVACDISAGLAARKIGDG